MSVYESYFGSNRISQSYWIHVHFDSGIFLKYLDANKNEARNNISLKSVHKVSKNTTQRNHEMKKVHCLKDSIGAILNNREYVNLSVPEYAMNTFIFFNHNFCNGKQLFCVGLVLKNVDEFKPLPTNDLFNKCSK